jgi:hypothetical protein
MIIFFIENPRPALATDACRILHKKPGFCQNKQRNQPMLIHLLGDPVFEHALLHPAHGEQIIKRCEQPVPNAVMALAGESLAVAHFDFRDRVTFNLERLNAR